MAKFAVSQDRHLTILFDDKADFMETTQDIMDSFERLQRKYGGGADDMRILLVLNIPIMDEEVSPYTGP